MSILEIIDEDQRAILTKSIGNLTEKCRTEIPMLRISVKKAVSKYPENSNAYHFANVPLRLRLAIADITLLFSKLLNERDPDQQNLFARMLSGQLYEFLEDVPSMLGKKYRAIIKSFPQKEMFENRLNSLISSFNDTGKAVRQDIR